MPLPRIVLSLAAGLALVTSPLLLQAQTVTAPAAQSTGTATVASTTPESLDRYHAVRDSVIREAVRLHALLEGQTSYFQNRAPRRGARSRRVTAYYLAASEHGINFRHKTRQRRNGTVEEYYRGYISGNLVLAERHVNGHLTYLRLRRRSPLRKLETGPLLSEAVLTREGYIRLGKVQPGAATLRYTYYLKPQAPTL